MAKKEKKQKKSKGAANTMTPPMSGVPPTSFSHGVPPAGTIPPTGAVPPTTMAGSATAAGIPPTGFSPTGTASSPMVDPSMLSPDQIAQIQLEEAIKESSDPSSKLKKLKCPLNIGSCLLNLLFLVVLTLGIVYLWVAIEVDKFNFITVSDDILSQYGIKNFFQSIGNWFKGVFGGKGLLLY